MFDDLGVVREAREVKGATTSQGATDGGGTAGAPEGRRPENRHPPPTTTPLPNVHPPDPPPRFVHLQKGGRREGIDDGR